MRKFLHGLIKRHFDYTARYHLKERFRSIDYKFVGAMLVLALLVVVAVRLY